MLERIDRHWPEFWAKVERLPDAAFASTTASGWTVQGMLAHVAAWQDETTHRLYRFLATGDPQPVTDDDEDRYNARVAAESADRMPSDLRRALRRSFERLRQAISELDIPLPDDDWVGAVVAGNSWGHYAEHLPEVEAALVESGGT
jgi:hypothetical protein